MKLRLILFIYLFSGCATHRQIVKDPFGFKTQWQEGSSETKFNDTGEVEVKFPAGKFGPAKSGFNWSSDLEPRDEYSISYEVKFAEEFNFVKGGKLPGLCGGHGKPGVKPAGEDKMSARIMWRREGNVVSYVYHLDQKGDYGDDFVWSTAYTNSIHFRQGHWEKIRFTVKLNSIGKSDGSIVGYLNGILAIKKTSLRFRNTESLKINRLCFNTFFGGKDKSWAPDKKQRLFIRELKVD